MIVIIYFIMLTNPTYACIFIAKKARFTPYKEGDVSNYLIPPDSVSSLVHLSINDGLQGGGGGRCGLARAGAERKGEAGRGSSREERVGGPDVRRRRNFRLLTSKHPADRKPSALPED